MGNSLSYLFGGGAATAADGEPESDRVFKFSSSARWQLYFNEIRDSSNLVVIDFSASWCGPCKFIKPLFNAMAERFTDVHFVQLDVDEVPDVAKDFRIQGMPTFVLLKRGTEVDRVVGAQKDKLERKIEQHRAIKP